MYAQMNLVFGLPYVPLYVSQEAAVQKAIRTQSVSSAVQAATDTTRWALLGVPTFRDNRDGGRGGDERL